MTRADMIASGTKKYPNLTAGQMVEKLNLEFKDNLLYPLTKQDVYNYRYEQKREKRVRLKPLVNQAETDTPTTNGQEKPKRQKTKRKYTKRKRVQKVSPLAVPAKQAATSEGMSLNAFCDIANMLKENHINPNTLEKIVSKVGNDGLTAFFNYRRQLKGLI